MKIEPLVLQRQWFTFKIFKLIKTRPFLNTMIIDLIIPTFLLLILPIYLTTNLSTYKTFCYHNFISMALVKIL